MIVGGVPPAGTGRCFDGKMGVGVARGDLEFNRCGVAIRQGIFSPVEIGAVIISRADIFKNMFCSVGVVNRLIMVVDPDGIVFNVERIEQFIGIRLVRVGLFRAVIRNIGNEILIGVGKIIQFSDLRRRQRPIVYAKVVDDAVE